MILTYAKRRRKSKLTPFGTKRRVRVNIGRRFEKKVEVNGEITLHEGYIYHGYLQIACVDLQKPFQAAVRYITWEPSQPTATRPLALQQNSVWYTYGWDLIRLRVSLRSLATPRQAKNICELYNNTGYILNLYSYTPYGKVTADGDVTQPIQWSSEMHGPELALVCYKTADGCKAGWTCVDRHAPEGRGAERRLRVNYRYYNPADGRWTRRDPIGIEGGFNVYKASFGDYIGLRPILFNQQAVTYIELPSLEVYTITPPRARVYGITEVTNKGIEDLVGITENRYGRCCLYYTKEEEEVIKVTVMLYAAPPNYKDRLGNTPLEHENVHVRNIANAWNSFIREIKPYIHCYPTVDEYRNATRAVGNAKMKFLTSLAQAHADFDRRAGSVHI